MCVEVCEDQGVFMCTRSSDSKQLVLTEELFTDDVMNSE